MLKKKKKKSRIENNLMNNVKIFGKEIAVKVLYGKVKNPELDFNGNEIQVHLPNKYKKNGNIEILKLAIEKLYDEIARTEIENVMEETRIMLNGLAPEDYVIKRIPNKLSKITENKTLIINPDIVKFDKQLLKNVILYEFCHLKYKTNCKSFYNMLQKHISNNENYEYLLKIA